MSPLITLLARRLGFGVIVLLATSVIIFTSILMLPGDSATERLGQYATPGAVAAWRKEHNLDRPAVMRYADWVGHLATGNLGRSLISDRPVSAMVAPRLENTAFLALCAACLSVPLSLFLGLLSVRYRGGVFDRVINFFVLFSVSFPEFFVAYIAILVVSVWAGWLPSLSDISAASSLRERLFMTALPAGVLALVVMGHMMRMTRGAVLGLMDASWVEMAMLKGVSPWRIITRHVLPNAWSPIINVVMINLAYLFVGVVIVENVFVYPGLGQLMVDAVQKRDVPVIQACSLIFSFAYVILNILADMLAIAANPRLRHRG